MDEASREARASCEASLGKLHANLARLDLSEAKLSPPRLFLASLAYLCLGHIGKLNTVRTGC